MLAKLAVQVDQEALRPLFDAELCRPQLGGEIQ